MALCRATKRDGSPCKEPASGPDGYCWAPHDPAHAGQRRRQASKAGRAKPNKELAKVKERLRELAEQVLAGEVAEDPAGVAARIYSVYLRAVYAGSRISTSENSLSKTFVNKERKKNGSLTHWEFARGVGLLAHHQQQTTPPSTHSGE